MKKSLVNYDTKWTNDYLTPSDCFSFKANTPIEEILAKLEEEINNRFSTFQEDYQNKSAYFNFNRLYRNLIPYYKGWHVLYREPGSKVEYHPITEQIGFRPKTKKRSLQRTVLTKTLRWTHELYPLIGRVEMQGVDSCETIAKQLNQKMNQPGFTNFFKRFEKDYTSFSKISKKIITQSKSKSGLNYQTNELCQTFCHDLQNLTSYSKPLHSLTFKNYKLEAFNISDLLQQNKITNTAKGWSVEILEKDQ